MAARLHAEAIDSFRKQAPNGRRRCDGVVMGLFRRKRRVEPARAPARVPAQAAPRNVDGGPSWMPAAEWERRLVAHQRQGRSDADIRATSQHLEKRGPSKPPTRSQSVARARSTGIVSRVEFMDPDTEARALSTTSSWMPDVRLIRERDRLLVQTPLGWVNPRSRTAYRVGVHSFAVAGTSHHEAAAKAGKFTPGSAVRLVREPDNPYDTNAVAVYAETGRRVVGYVPKGQARRLAKLMDAGTALVAVSVRGSGAGSDGARPHVLVCEPRLYEHLTR